MATKRTYRDPCGIARALDLVGERWALLIVRELLLGPKRFTDLRAGLPELGPDVLSQRLRELEAAGVVGRETLPPPAASRVYVLSDWGEQLEPVVLALGRWGSRAPFPDAYGELGVDAIVLALKTLFDPTIDQWLSAVYELRFADQSFRLTIVGGALTIDRGTVENPIAMIATDTATLAGVLWHRESLAKALRSGAIVLEGSREAVDRLFALFPPPVPASAVSSRGS